MKIHKLSNVLALPFILMVLFCMYMLFIKDQDDYLTYALAPLIVIALIYMFQPQINYWWLSKNPITLDEEIERMLRRTNPIYSSLSKEKKMRFDQEVYLLTEGNAFIAKGMERDFEVPYDVKFMISQIPVTMEYGLSTKKLKRFERIVTYKHAFPSPRYKFLHAAETDVEDGVIIVSLEQAQNAFAQPNNFYNNMWHAYAEAFVKTYPNLRYPDVDNNIWHTIQSVSGFSQQHIQSILGFQSIDPVSVLINLYFNNHHKLKESATDIFDQLDMIFNQVDNF